MFICGYNAKHLECSWGLLEFNKGVVVNYSKSVTSLGLGIGYVSVLGMASPLLTEP